MAVLPTEVKESQSLEIFKQKIKLVKTLIAALDCAKILFLASVSSKIN